MSPSRRKILVLLALGFGLLSSGCATHQLDAARGAFYAGRYDEAANRINPQKAPARDRVLVRMERGMMLQAKGDYDASSREFIEAYDEIERLTTYSLSKGGASLVVNDNVQDFRGTPFERTLLHCFTAKNHLAQAHWENAAVEARRIIQSLSPEAKGDYPDDAYSRYMAGFCLEMIGDRSNAALQYRRANALLTHVVIDDQTGRLYPLPPSGTNDTETVAKPKFDRSRWTNELVCFVLLGRAPRGDEVWNRYGTYSRSAYAEIYSGGQLLGRSHTLADTADLAFTTAQKESARKAIKTASRIALKEGIAYQIQKDNALMGELTRLILIGLLERPDVRSWETLPRWLQVARVPCPADLSEYEIVLKSANGVEVARHNVTRPLARNGGTYVSFTRDIFTR